MNFENPYDSKPAFLIIDSYLIYTAACTLWSISNSKFDFLELVLGLMAVALVYKQITRSKYHNLFRLFSAMSLGYYGVTSGIYLSRIINGKIVDGKILIWVMAAYMIWIIAIMKQHQKHYKYLEA